MMQGKRLLITGVINDASIATGIAKACHAQGAELAFTYQNDRVKDRVVKLADSLDCEICLPCDVTSDEQIAEVASALTAHWPEGLDGLVHSIAFAPAEVLTGDFVEATTREGFAMAQDISAYSFIALCRAVRPQLREGASILTLTYHGSERMVSSYNVMGVAKASLEASVRYLADSMGRDGYRVNALSPGPVRTSASAGVKKFRRLMAHVKRRSPIQRTVNTDEVGNVAAFLLSDLSSGISGETIYADLGFHTTIVDPTAIG